MGGVQGGISDGSRQSKPKCPTTFVFEYNYNVKFMCRIMGALFVTQWFPYSSITAPLLSVTAYYDVSRSITRLLRSITESVWFITRYYGPITSANMSADVSAEQSADISPDISANVVCLQTCT